MKKIKENILVVKIVLFVFIANLAMDILTANGQNLAKDLFMVICIIGIIYLLKRVEQKEVENNAIQNAKIVSAKVILVDNFHTPKKLICQFDRENGIVQYQKEKKDNFLEMVGDIVEVKVDVMNESRYEILDK